MPTLLLLYSNISFWNCSFKMANLQTRAKARDYIALSISPPRVVITNGRG